MSKNRLALGVASAMMIAASGVAGCARDQAAAPPITTFVCPDGAVLSASFPSDERVLLNVEGRDYELPRLISASGARYGDDRTIFWNKGRQALFERSDGTSFVGCVARSS